MDIKQLYFLLIFSLFNVIFCTVSSFAEIILKPMFSLADTYNDNIFYDYSNKKNDHVSKISIGLGALLKSKRSEINMDYNAGAEFYHKTPKFNNISHGGFISAYIKSLTDFTLNIKNSFNLSEGVGEFEDIRGLRNSLISENQKRIFNNLNCSLSKKIRSRTFFNIFYENYYEDVDVIFEVDEKRNNLGTSLYFNLDKSGRNKLTVTYSNTYYTYIPNRGIQTIEQDFYEQTYKGGYTYKLNNRSSFSIYGGTSINKYENPLAKNDSLYIFGTGIDKTFNPFYAKLSYDKKINSGEGRGGAVLGERYKVTVSKEKASKYYLNLLGSYNINKFLVSNLIDYNRDNRLWSVSTGVRYYLFKTIDFSLNYSYSDNDYEDDMLKFGDYYYQKVDLGIQVSFQKELIFYIGYNYSERFFHDIKNKSLLNTNEFINKMVFLKIIYNPEFKLD